MKKPQRQNIHPTSNHNNFWRTVRNIIQSALLFAMLAFPTPPAWADNAVQVIPPTPIGSMTPCPSGTQQVLSYSGTNAGGTQAGINCVPISTDAQGDLAASGYVKAGNTTAACYGATAGAIRFNTASLAFEGCNGSSWQAIGGGGNTLIAGGCQTYWSSCPGGYHPTSYFSPGTYNCCDRCGNPAWRYTVCSQ